jgi:hypothetical protein
LDSLHAPEPLWAAVKGLGVPELSPDEDAVRAALAGGANAAEAVGRGAASGWGLPPPLNATPSLLPSEPEVEFARSLVGDSRCPLIGFCPGASSPLKRWPESRFAAVADWALAEGWGVIVLGDRHDQTAATMQRLMSHGTRCLVAKGLHLRRVAAVLARCAAVVSNDSGLMHIAAAVRTPVVAIFGPTSPRLYLPRGRTEGLAAGQDCPHRTDKLVPPGCWNSERCLIAPDHCTAAVATEAVLATLRRMLAVATMAISAGPPTTTSGSETPVLVACASASTDDARARRERQPLSNVPSLPCRFSVEITSLFVAVLRVSMPATP